MTIDQTDHDTSRPAHADDVDVEAAAELKAARWRRRMVTFGWVATAFIVLTVMWRFGGADVSFDTDATADPDTKFD